MSDFWFQLPKPFFCLAPMEGVTDTVFRKVVASAGKPDVMFSEFTGVEQLFSPGYRAIVQNLEYSLEEQPLVLQIWGTTPELFYNAAQLAVEMGFVGVDINMGCPSRSIISKGACSALIKDKPLAREIVEATKEGCKGKIGLSVKIRLGYDYIETESWVPWLLASEIDALIIHGRISKEMSFFPANWDEIGKAVKIRDEMKVRTVIIGNGDVLSKEEGLKRVEQTGVDGVMIGRGIFNDPWLFGENRSKKSATEKIELLKYHLKLWQEVWGGDKRFERLKRFFKVYIVGFKGAVELRGKMMESKSLEEALCLLAEWER